ncbi:hypothetical protein J6590_027687 [Homalodisca vitripennis]|nr:hypothetical protein J6590_027687 [Homalodisca vitripennis]
MHGVNKGCSMRSVASAGHCGLPTSDHYGTDATTLPVSAREHIHPDFTDRVHTTVRLEARLQLVKACTHMTGGMCSGDQLDGAHFKPDSVL